MWLYRKLSSHWYRSSLTWLTIILLPLSFLFRLIIKIRYFLYHTHYFSSQRVAVPVIVVGNLTVGGTGKTPLVLWLANALQAAGYSPGIVSRGVGGQYHNTPHQVEAADTTELVGDEAFLLAKRSSLPVVVCANRLKAAEYLLQKNNCDVLITDDGLQHYRLMRDIEIVVMDGERGWGNGQLLPAGPLREPPSRLKTVNFIVVNGGEKETIVPVESYQMILQPMQMVSVAQDEQAIHAKKRIHAVAAIGHPERFFRMLSAQGFEVIPHAFPDHHQFIENDFDFHDELPIVMTEKDAVKCKAFATHRYWYVPVMAEVSERLLAGILRQLGEKKYVMEKNHRYDVISNMQSIIACSKE